METNVGDFPMLFCNAKHIPRSTVRFSQSQVRHVDARARHDRIQFVRPHGKSTVNV